MSKYEQIIDTQNVIFLTGAGFSANFDGFLAKDMAAKIFNSGILSGEQNVKYTIRESRDYEDAYSEIMTRNDFSNLEKEKMRKAVLDIYKRLDETLRKWVFNNDNPTAFDVYKFNSDLLGLLQYKPGGGFFFTLNQDLLMERRNGYKSLGAPNFNQEFRAINGEFKQNYFVTLSRDNCKTSIKEDLINGAGIRYIKLHGSYGWNSSTGNNAMVIGTGKEELIKSEPLLNAYFDLFKEVLSAGNKKLLIIGYGFGDDHINKIIWDAAKNNGLKIYIINPKPMDEFDPGNFVYSNFILWDAVEGYFPYKFRDVFPPNQSGSDHINEIKEAIIAEL